MLSDFLPKFGFLTKKTELEEKEPILQPMVSQTTDDASFVVGSTHYGRNIYGFSTDMYFSNENELIQKYREAALYPEVDLAISDIVNEAIDGDTEDEPVKLDLENIEGLSENLKEKFRDEFKYILSLLNFNNDCHSIFRKYYVDGRLSYFIVIDDKKKKEGIQELRYISSFDIKKVREERTKPGVSGIQEVESVEEYFVYAPGAFKKQTKKDSNGTNTRVNPSVGIKLSKDSVCHITSGLYDEASGMVYSHLHKALKAINQLKMIEDAIVIYRLARAPERRVFYIDVGNMPKTKAEEYISSIMRKYQNKSVYDAETGEVKSSKHTQTMMEDFWMPRREGGKGTEVTTLPGGQNLGQLEDVQYFQKKVFFSLNVPFSRISPDGQSAAYVFGRSSETSRDEVRFARFVNRLRRKFSEMFLTLLEKQLLLKNIIDGDTWDEIKDKIVFSYGSDNFFSELKEAEILKERFGTLDQVSQHVGTYISKEYVRKKILKMTDEEIKEMEKQIEEEIPEDDGLGVEGNPEQPTETQPDQDQEFQR